MSTDILFAQDGHLAVVTLNRPQALNALTLPMIIDLQQQLQIWQADKDVHAVVIQATPGKAFCAGGDIRSLYEMRQAHHQQMKFFWHEYRLNHFIHCFPKPYIALMNGMTMGGGVGIALHGSHPIASEHFLFAMPETGIGFFPDIGASYLLARCPDHLGMYLGLSGQRLNAYEAQAAGLVKQVVAAERFAEFITELKVLDLRHDAHAKVDAHVKAFALPILPPQYDAKDVTSCFGQSSLAAIDEALAQGDSPWHQSSRKTLSEKSPSSLKLTFEQLTRAEKMSMAECIQMDYCLVGHFMHGHDFYEGVRALLIDKDKSPQWQKAVSSDELHAYFECGIELPLLTGSPALS